jgi:hypothetical protein
MKRQICVALVFVCSISLSACSIVKGKGEAEKVAERFFQERIDNGWAGSSKYYSDLVFTGETKEQLTAIHRLVTKAMGRLENYLLTDWDISAKLHTNQISGIVVTLEYDTYYEKGRGSETLTFHKPFMGSDFLIIHHNFNSELIQKLINEGIERAASQDSV